MMSAEEMWGLFYITYMIEISSDIQVAYHLSIVPVVMWESLGR